MTENNYLDRIRLIAERFRYAIDAACRAGDFDRDSAMKDFPKGCCGLTSELLGEYFFENDIHDLWYVSGTFRLNKVFSKSDYYNRQTHAWISVGDPFSEESIIVDITGDQFSLCSEVDCYNTAVFVGKMDDFHKKFEYEKEDVYRINRIVRVEDIILLKCILNRIKDYL